MVKVLQVIDSMDRGGAQVFVMNTLRSINRGVFQFDFLVTTSKKCAYDDEIKNMGGKIYQVPSRRKGIRKNWNELKAFFKENKYDVVHFHTSCPSYIEPLIAAKRAGVKKIILHSHSTSGPKGLYHEIMRRIYRPQIKKFATHYYACSKEAAEWMYGRFIRPDSITIIPNGIDTGKFTFSNRNYDMKRKELGISKDKLVIGHVGRFAKVKNHDFLINLFKVINEKKQGSKLLLIGDGLLLDTIRNKVQELGISNDVLFLKEREDVSELMQAMDILVMPSLYEGLPLSLVEAQASGLPCIVSDTVSKEAALTDLIEFISLGNNIMHWSDRVLLKSSVKDRKQYNEIVKNSGYDISQTSKMLEGVYINEKM
ncbi:glycosyltransferase family 1 protein [Bacillus mycoides]|uniref:glycosyltransferase family 1 protein n=1 Tax=Bacillus mycoides TaxID=1405 RepID=UPI0021120AE3|nr:glycosyltransferase family 1 protein [Bacillus mycoides]MCQ6534398.1 glycosyltransferase family 1 protein [Bacillus mycoides]